MKPRQPNKNRKVRECIIHKSSLIQWQEVLTTRRTGWDTTRQHTGQLIRGLLLIPERRCLPVPWGKNIEEAIDSSHHNLWEGQTLPFPFWVTGVIIPKFWKGLDKDYFCSPMMARHQRIFSTVALTNSRYGSLLFPECFLTSVGHWCRSVCRRVVATLLLFKSGIHLFKCRKPVITWEWP